ncbi:YicC/YloC family endoribonuclease [Gemmata sp. JC717]|uniref:YicC/YloC family endoribonuclease n=1 Tax=Gemmata algarum TaxID=2975278 RepID=UPI0021BB190D|nr:YicC/YloC family endoribonuclease [Gemmata algarum]MDY3553023.1 YicC/YloC family endoribonuclease [Gemmata algarum]
MLLSMTGFGAARIDAEGFGVAVEVRAVNNRHLKLTVRGSDPYPLLESELEKVVRRHVRRGTLHVHIRVERQGGAAAPVLNTAVLGDYLKQLRTACLAAGTPELIAPLAAGALSLPGVAPETRNGAAPPDDEWPVVEKALEAALVKLTEMRREEGKALATELLGHRQTIADQLDAIKTLLPGVVTEYRHRILERVKTAVADAGLVLNAETVVREVALFADRTDVSEEVMRLSSHLDQFAALLWKGEEAGRKLEFVIQEMGRETNTIGSKAGDVVISRHVVEMKSTLEKLREQVQNVE